MEKTYNKKLVASAVLIVASLALLMGLTFAWFTDSATNRQNKIQAGTLDITATVADVNPNPDAGAGPKYELSGVNGDKEFVFGAAKNVEDASPLITEDKWEPGKTSAKLVTVTNNGNLAAKVKLQFDVTDNGLQDALWFDFVKVEGGNKIGEFQQRPMSELSTIADNLEFPVGPSNSDGAAADSELPNTVSFILVYGMDESIGNEYQGKTFAADVTILATQYTYEKDGFGSDQYDASAEYPVMDAGFLKDAIKSSKTIDLHSDVFMAEGEEIDTNVARTVIGSKAVTLNLNGNSIHFDSGEGNNNFAALYVNSGKGKLTVNGDGVIDATATTGAYCFHLMGGKLSKPTLTINGGTYIGNPTVVNVQYGTAYINGGFFSGKPAGNVDDDQYRYLLNCIDANYGKKYANIVVKGGTFVNFDPSDNQAEGPGTNFVADGYKVVQEAHGEDIWYTVVPA